MLCFGCYFYLTLLRHAFCLAEYVVVYLPIEGRFFHIYIFTHTLQFTELPQQSPMSSLGSLRHASSFLETIISSDPILAKSVSVAHSQLLPVCLSTLTLI